MVHCGDTSMLRFDKFKGVNHSRLARIFYMPELYEWLFAHSLNDSVRQINREVVIEALTLNNSYKDLKKNLKKITVINPPRSASTTNTTRSAASTNTNRSAVTSNANDSSVWYTIKKGDTLGAIARQHRTSVSKLCEINNLKTTSILRIGQKIIVQ